MSVVECDELDLPGRFGALVAIEDGRSSCAALAARLRWWLRVSVARRIVVVATNPRELKGIIEGNPSRVRVLPAPAMGWEVADALRAASSRFWVGA